MITKTECDYAVGCPALPKGDGEDLFGGCNRFPEFQKGGASRNRPPVNWSIAVIVAGQSTPAWPASLARIPIFSRSSICKRNIALSWPAYYCQNPAM